MTRQVSTLMTNAACKWSFSALKLVRTYLPTTTGYPSLHLMMLHVHRGLVIPACMRKELMSLAHATHIDIEGCLRRVRECFFWRRIASDVKENVFECDV